MKTRNLTICIFFILFFNTALFSQVKEEFKPTFSVGGTVFTGWQYNIDDADFLAKIDTSSSGIDDNMIFGYKPVKNQFEISRNTYFLERAYINIKAALTPQINAKLTPDIFSYTDQSGKTQFAYQVKAAYVDYTPLSLSNGTALSFTLGVNSNQWVSNMDKYTGYRFVAKSLTDYSWVTAASRSGNTINKTLGSYFSSADLGLTLKFTLPNKYADLYFAIVDGNGYRNLSFDNRFKDVQVTGFIYPLSGMIAKNTDKMKKAGKTRLDGITDLTLGGFAYLGKLDKGENYTLNGAQYKRNRFGGMLHLRYNFKNIGFFRLGGEMSLQSNQDPSSSKPDSAVTTDASGISGFLEFCPPVKEFNEKISLFARYDMFDPNTANDALSTVKGFNNNNDKQSLLIFGLFYKPAKVLTFGFSYHMSTFQDNFAVKYDGTVTKNINRLFFNTVLDF